jgi:hypothetical protein
VEKTKNGWLASKLIFSHCKNAEFISFRFQIYSGFLVQA